MSVLTDTAPKRIWLCVSDDEDDYDLPYPELYAEDAEITWSTDQPVAVTIEYVREDLSEIAKLREERDALRHDIERHVAICAEQATEIERLRERAESAETSERPLLQLRDELLAENERLRGQRGAFIEAVESARKERDAYAALLNEAQGFIPTDTGWDYTTDAGGYLYDRIDAALAKGKA